jgi:hypothetical protein
LSESTTSVLGRLAGLGNSNYALHFSLFKCFVQHPKHDLKARDCDNRQAEHNSLVLSLFDLSPDPDVLGFILTNFSWRTSENNCLPWLVLMELSLTLLATGATNWLYHPIVAEVFLTASRISYALTKTALYIGNTSLVIVYYYSPMI